MSPCQVVVPDKLVPKLCNFLKINVNNAVIMPIVKKAGSTWLCEWQDNRRMWQTKKLCKYELYKWMNRCLTDLPHCDVALTRRRWQDILRDSSWQSMWFVMTFYVTVTTHFSWLVKPFYVTRHSTRFDEAFYVIMWCIMYNQWRHSMWLVKHYTQLVRSFCVTYHSILRDLKKLPTWLELHCTTFKYLCGWRKIILPT